MVDRYVLRPLEDPPADDTNSDDDDAADPGQPYPDPDTLM